jgi:hypothetical protein
MLKCIGAMLTAIGGVLFIPPQAILGVNELKWAYRYSFPGEVLVAICTLCLGLYIYNFRRTEM